MSPAGQCQALSQLQLVEQVALKVLSSEILQRVVFPT